MDTLETMIMAESKRQGVVPNAASVKQATTDLCGSSLTSEGLISMPGKGSISPADFVNTLRRAMPDAFSPLAKNDKSAPTERRPGETLTDFMRRQIEKRPQKATPTDWDAVRSRVTGLTAKSMDHISKNRSAQ